MSDFIPEAGAKDVTTGSPSFRALLMLLMAVAGAGFAGCTPKEAALSETLDGVQFVYSVSDPLQDSLKREILSLASRQGATNVELVEISRGAPPDTLWAMVKERANVSNRVERLRELCIGISWDRAGLLPFKRVERQSTPELIWDETHCNLLLFGSDTSNRMRLDTKISIETADDIVQYFLTNNWKPPVGIPYMTGKSFHELIGGASYISIRGPHSDRDHNHLYELILWRDLGDGFVWGFNRDPETGAISKITAGYAIK